MKQKLIVSRYLLFIYALGVPIAAMGVFLMKSSTLGLGPWGVAAYELNELLKPLLGFFTFGLASSVHTYAMIFFILLIRRNLKSAFVFVSVLIMNGMVDFYDFVVFPQWTIVGLPAAIGSHLLGFLLYCLGSAFLILSTFPGMVIEEFTFAIMKVLGVKNYPVMRTIVAYFGFVLAIIYGALSGTNASSLTILSFFLGVAFGPVIQFTVKTIRQSSLGKKLKPLTA
ncbi:MAG: hypothetical protein ACO3H6_02465 [Bacilli bacterium]